MKVVFLTICLDAMPFLPMQLETFNRLNCDWTWLISEGAASNTNCTSWCKPQSPRFSRDGSHEFILSLWSHPRVRIVGKQSWNGKVEMCNAQLKHIVEPCVLMQIDADELWSASQLETIVQWFSDHSATDAMQFYCRYFLGPNIVTVGKDSYGNRHGEWLRAWRFSPGMRFIKHEPPVLSIAPKKVLGRAETSVLGLTFDHWSYVFDHQVAYKEQFYGYPSAVEHWRRLQQNTRWPVNELRKYLPWVGEDAKADLLWK